MKVRVVLTIDVDVDAWRDEYSNPDLTAAEIREDVRSSIVAAAVTDGVIVPPGIIRDAWLDGSDKA
jgi:hypothetical protein